MCIALCKTTFVGRGDGRSTQAYRRWCSSEQINCDSYFVAENQIAYLCIMSSDNLWMNFELCFLNFNQVRFIFKETRAEHLFEALRRPVILSSTWMTLPVFPNVDDCKQNARGFFMNNYFSLIYSRNQCLQYLKVTP